MVSVSVRYLFYQPMDEKIKTWPLRFPAKENPNMEKALFDWPNQPKATRFCIRSINQSNRSRPFVCCVCFVRAFLFQGHTKIALTKP